MSTPWPFPTLQCMYHTSCLAMLEAFHPPTLSTQNPPPQQSQAPHSPPQPVLPPCPSPSPKSILAWVPEAGSWPGSLQGVYDPEREQLKARVHKFAHPWERLLLLMGPVQTKPPHHTPHPQVTSSDIGRLMLWLPRWPYTITSMGRLQERKMGTNQKKQGPQSTSQTRNLSFTAVYKSHFFSRTPQVSLK